MNKAETINILCATDQNYAPYCGIMLTSLFESNKDYHFVVYIFEDGSVTEENVRKYQRLAKKYRNEIVLKTVNKSLVEGFPLKENFHITLPTYFRLLADKVLPEETHKTIYLDCDVIIVGDILPLWQMNVGDFAMAGVIDCTSCRLLHCERLCYDSSYGYVNAGVLFLNLDYWRVFSVRERLLEYVRSNQNDKVKLEFMDQDALNALLYKNKMVLQERFNFQVCMFENQFFGSYSKDFQHHLIEEGKNALIIHYAGGLKPWNYRRYGGPFFSEWEKYRRKSLWRDCRNIEPLKKHVKHMVKRYLFPGLFRKQHPEWVLTNETKCYYH